MGKVNIQNLCHKVLEGLAHLTLNFLAAKARKLLVS